LLVAAYYLSVICESILPVRQLSQAASMDLH
jgi:hypothetical protein